jgi:hypothetical protein
MKLTKPYLCSEHIQSSVGDQTPTAQAEVADVTLSFF